MTRRPLLSRLALAALVAATAGLTACPSSPRDQGLGVRIRFAASSRASCARLIVRWADGQRQGPMLSRGHPAKETLTIAVYRSAAMPAEVQLVAEGFAGAGCDAPGNPLESSAARTAAFEAKPGDLVELLLEASPCAVPGECSNPACEATACAGGGTCQGGFCKGAQTELDCDDGQDNDGDGKVDCEDPDCVGRACVPSDPCLVGALCNAASACEGGAPRVCPPPGQCQADAGACNPLDGGCEYPPATDAPCASGDLCREGERCTLDGVCGGGSAKVCYQDVAACLSDAGSCDPALGCRYAQLTSACSTGDACWVEETCGGGVCGGGRAMSCAAPPGECYSATGSCDGGGCSYAPLSSGEPCDGGTCSAGLCQRDFGYAPSNFDPLLTSPGPALVIDCPVVIDTSQPALNHFPGWCAGGTMPAFSFLPVADPGVRKPMLIAVTGLTVGDGGSITVRGGQPIIFAVYGDATIKGFIAADAKGAAPGPGAQPCNADGGGGDGWHNTTSWVGGGGGGAGLGTRGANGSDGQGGSFGSGAAGGGGNPSPVPGFSPLRAGCEGGAGWNYGGSSPPGGGGGGLQLSVSGTLAVTGRISAGGGGGGAADSTRHGAGSGGGSGGVILLEADVLSLAGAKVTANGGAGGGGKADLNGGAREADAGADADPESASPAIGGDPGVSVGTTWPGTGGRGGNGGAGTVAPSAGGAPVTYGGGGGGGGAVGRIFFNAKSGCATNGALFSPGFVSGGPFTCP